MKQIKHIVVLMLENRSFFNVLGDMKGVRGGTRDPESPHTNCDSEGKVYKQTAMTKQTLCASYSFPNDYEATKLSIMNDCKGFVHAFEKSFDNLIKDKGIDDAQNQQVESANKKGTWLGEPMTYFPFGSLPSIHTLAKHFAVCEAWHSSVPSATWPNRLFALTGTSNGLSSMPQSPGDFKVSQTLQETQETIFTLLEEKKVPFKIYYDDVPLTLLLHKNWKKEILMQHHIMDEFFKDCKKEEDEFPAFSWIEPKYSGAANDFHPPHNPLNGDHLVGSVYNAIRENQQLWESTLFIVTFDEHGGFFDPIIPPQVDECIIEALHSEKYDTHCFKSDVEKSNLKQCFSQYGIRVPTILISPALTGFGIIDSTLYDHTSLLASICVRWNLSKTRLGERVRFANDFWHLFENLKHLKQEEEEEEKERQQQQEKEEQNEQILLRKIKRLPYHLELVPYDNKDRSGKKGIWNDFQKDIATGFTGMLNGMVNISQGWNRLKTNFISEKYHFVDFIQGVHEQRNLIMNTDSSPSNPKQKKRKKINFKNDKHNNNKAGLSQTLFKQCTIL